MFFQKLCILLCTIKGYILCSLKGNSWMDTHCTTAEVIRLFSSGLNTWPVSEKPEWMECCDILWLSLSPCLVFYGWLENIDSYFSWKRCYCWVSSGWSAEPKHRAEDRVSSKNKRELSPRPVYLSEAEVPRISAWQRQPYPIFHMYSSSKQP